MFSATFGKITITHETSGTLWLYLDRGEGTEEGMEVSELELEEWLMEYYKGNF